MKRFAIAILMLGCGADKAPSGDTGTPTGDTDPTTGATECAATSDALSDPRDGIAGDEAFCEDNPYLSKVAGATTFYVGDFSVDNCGAVSGIEEWGIYPNSNWTYDDCTAVWDVTGTLGGPLEAGNIDITMTAEINLFESDCVPDADDQDIWIGFETQELSYNVELAADGTATFLLPSGTLGSGEWNANHLTYLSEPNCKAF